MERCNVTVSDPSGWNRHKCGNPVKVERDGVGYCNRHDPERVKARDAKRKAAKQAVEDERRAKRAEIAKPEQALCDALGMGKPNWRITDWGSTLDGIKLTKEEAAALIERLKA